MASSAGNIPVGTVPNGFEAINDLSTVKTLTPPAGSIVALVVPEGGEVRWRDDGSDPTATVGVLLYVGSGIKLYGGEMAAARFIQSGAGAKLNVKYGK